MFTGIIRHVGEVTETRRVGAGLRLTIDLGPLAEDLSEGDSVAVNGLCLTAVSPSGTTAAFDVVAESVARSNLDRLRAGSRVNLERALRVSDRFDGHIVQGHVDGVATVRQIDRRANERTVTFSADRALAEQMVPKGSVAIDGVSLTLTEVGDGRFGVSLIPTTLADTTLETLAVGDSVHIEADVLGKYVRGYLEARLGGRSGGSGLTMDSLRDAGFA